jgi:hypothetical protein
LEKGIMNRFMPLWLIVAVLVAMAGFSNVGVGSQLACYPPSSSGVVDKIPGGAFVVEISFKNTGATNGTWSVNVAFEGEKWSWVGTAQTLKLKPSDKKTLTWNGTVPEDAPIDSVARLIVYYGNSFVPLDWWVHVVPAAELTITSSTVR